jgi:hypothetical protein
LRRKRWQRVDSYVSWWPISYFLWTYPKNVLLVVTQFGFEACECYLQGKELWCLPTKIAAMKKEKIV